MGCFQKAVIEYNLTFDLFKSDLDWKKDHPNVPASSEELAEYNCMIGQVNQRVGAIALMEATIGHYINTVGEELVTRQALIIDHNNLQFMAQGKHNNTEILDNENIPMTDVAPTSFQPPLLATPAPSAEIVLAPETPAIPQELMPNNPFDTGSTLTSLPSTKTNSPQILLAHTFDTLPSSPSTPKAMQMDVSPPRSDSAKLLLPAMLDVVMSDAQKSHIEEVLKEYHVQEQAALQALHASQQCSHEAEVTLKLERAKIIDAEHRAKDLQGRKALQLSVTSPTPIPAVSMTSRSSLLLSIPSDLLPLPSWPNAPSVPAPVVRPPKVH